ncbi:uncharacterized protein LOC117171353 [Belonocnema kinseyi]|uniref:uncharacterized protein LOC117171353 n=1 Tax=Belonocnema kinseyi TaxID=2817044 RepID=UPI00143D983D|nr:uncharacterized protein LOC117171353 [Belonocnema kinseyi]
MQNFDYAGNILCEIRSQMEIDGHFVTAEYISPSVELMQIPELPSLDWYYRHVFESQYCLQIIKCGKTHCCPEFRSNLKSVLTEGYMPPPYPLKQTPSGLMIP